ncbi:hypothetical protein LT493_12070 [Streptomyces tricolor]|nr:hypothetical protein [Streptomyces tricolor]
MPTGDRDDREAVDGTAPTHPRRRRRPARPARPPTQPGTDAAEEIHAAGASRGPVAVVGMACRFPGADDLDGFWRMLRRGGDAISPRHEACATAAVPAGTCATSNSSTRSCSGSRRTRPP